jgi:hypothetical protein
MPRRIITAVLLATVLASAIALPDAPPAMKMVSSYEGQSPDGWLGADDADDEHSRRLGSGSGSYPGSYGSGSTASYTKKTTGTCGAAHAITSKEECDAAAVSLNHVDKTAVAISTSSWHKGCFAHQANSLYFNTHPNAAKECSTAHPCICRTGTHSGSDSGSYPVAMGSGSYGFSDQRRRTFYDRRRYAYGGSGSGGYYDRRRRRRTFYDRRRRYAYYDRRRYAYGGSGSGGYYDRRRRTFYDRRRRYSYYDRRRYAYGGSGSGGYYDRRRRTFYDRRRHYYYGTNNGSGGYAHTNYILQTSGRCAHYLTSAAACALAAASLGLPDTSVSDDGQSGVNYDPRGCYYENNSLKYNGQQTNTGSCTSYDHCLCASSAHYGSVGSGGMDSSYGGGGSNAPPSMSGGAGPATEESVKVGTRVRLVADRAAFEIAFQNVGYRSDAQSHRHFLTYVWNDAMTALLGATVTVVDRPQPGVFGLPKSAASSQQPVWFYPFAVIDSVLSGGSLPPSARRAQALVELANLFGAALLPHGGLSPELNATLEQLARAPCVAGTPKRLTCSAAGGAPANAVMASFSSIHTFDQRQLSDAQGAGHRVCFCIDQNATAAHNATNATNSTNATAASSSMKSSYGGSGSSA